MSVLAHLLVVALIFVLSEVRKFDQVAADTVPVEIVTPQEAAEVAPEPTPSLTPTPDFQLPSLDKPPLEKSEAAAKSEPEQKQPEQKPAEPKQPAQKQATPKQTPQPSPQPSPTPQSVAKAEPPPALQVQPSPQPQSSSPPQQTYAQPQPDLSLKYGVNLGLPPSLPAAPHAANEGGADNFDAPAIEDAKVESGAAAEFRRHLKSCLKRPDGLGSDDDVKVKLRVLMTTDGRLAGPPQLIEATASPKGPLLIRSATEALKACQPYAMLPRDRYREWKVLDLDFTPRDFAS